MRGRKGFTLIELLVVIAIIAILAAILFPVFAKARRNAQAANCESNMKQIGNAIKMYLSDWDDTYPTNRVNSAGVTGGGSVLPEFNLSINTSDGTYGKNGDPKIDPNTGKPIRFVGKGTGNQSTGSGGGVSWVEGLYNYVEAVTNINDPNSIWKCQSALSNTRNVSLAPVSYAFNYNLVEVGEGAVKGAATLMMVREMDGYLMCGLRPINLSTNTDTPPSYAFLGGNGPTGGDGYNKNDPLPNYKLHGNGSHILFADGHVKLFSVGVFAQTPWRSNILDDTKGQWFNSTQRTIAITPY